MTPGSTIVSFLLLLAAGASAQDVRVEASVNANRIGVQDVLELTVSISGDAGSIGEPELPEIDRFRVAGRSTADRVSIVNGRRSSTRSFIYRLLPQSEGEFTIGPMRVEVDGESHRTEPITVEVVAGSVVPRRRRPGLLDPFGSDPFGRELPRISEEDVFVRAEVSGTEVYQGEQVVVTYRLYAPLVPLGAETEDDPPLTGFWIEDVELGSETRAERRTVDGKSYISMPIKKRIVFPTRSGTLTIPPVTFSTAFRLSTGDPFDAFFSRASRPITLRSQPVELRVEPLPKQGRTGAFSGAVGQYRLDASLSREAIEAGDPVTLTLSIEGRGNLRSVESPVLEELRGFRTFDPKSESRIRAGENGLSGKKRWEYVLVPESAGEKEIGPFEFQYFDPGKERYLTASVGPLSLRVRGGATAGGTAPDVSPRGQAKLLRQDIRFLKEPPDELGVLRKPFHESAIFYLSLLLPVLWNLGLVAYRRRREKERADSQLFRSRRAHRMARKRLRRARKLAAGASREFYEETASALYRYVGDKASVSPSGLTSEKIEELLLKGGVPEELREQLLEVISHLEQARFTPGTRSKEEMEPLAARAEELIVSLERHLAR